MSAAERREWHAGEEAQPRMTEAISLAPTERTLRSLGVPPGEVLGIRGSDELVSLRGDPDLR